MDKKTEKLYWAVLRERVATNAFARDVFAETAVPPRALRSAEDLYRAVVWSVRGQAEEERWRTPRADEIAAGTSPYFELHQDGECVLVERVQEEGARG